MATKKKAAKSIVLIPYKYVEAVNNGVKWLDLTFGSRKAWLRRMDMKNFNIRSGASCVAGNIFKDAYVKDSKFTEDAGYDRFVEMMDALGVRASERFGFITESDKGMQHLQDLWVRKIHHLKATAARK